MTVCPVQIDCLCVHQLFEHQVLRTPDAIAVEFEEVQLSYQQLNVRANQIAAHLLACGVASEEPVGILMDRSPDWVAAVLGILKAGATYVPLDSSYPRERIEFMVQDAQIRWMLGQPTCRQDIQLPGVTRICCEDWQQIEELATVNSVSDQLAYVIYTSGSTGQPKGVAMPHRPLVNLIEWQRSRSQTATQRTLQFAPMSFDVSFQELFVTLAEGGTLVLLPEAVRQDFRALLDRLDRLSIERLFLPFVALQQLAEQAVVTGKKLLQLREIITAGEALRITPAIREWFSQLLPNCTLYNQYGPTETHVVTEFHLAGSPQLWALLPSIGRPIERATVFILDEQLQQVPVGAVGELCVGGISLARGYLNRQELTAERFVYPPQIPQRLYRTGDLARQHPDGALEYLGRRDNQIKVRGYRVEPGEVEAALESHPLVRQGVVVQSAQTEAKQLVACVVLTEHESSVEPLELKRFLRQRLPSYMVPDVIQILKSLPLTPSGKVDRRCLPSPVKQKVHSADKPQTATQQQLVILWQDCLDLEQIGVNENFFDLGGNSLKMIQILLEMERQFKVPISPTVFLQSPTIAETAKLLEGGTPLPPPTVSDLLDDYGKLALDPTIALQGRQHFGVGEQTGSFLTGATGFLGAFLLHELLEQTDRPVYCLVRASSATAAHRRIRQNLRLYGLWQPHLLDRIVPVIGDLSQPLLGLSEEEFADLARHINVIYHNGSQVNFIYPYAALKAANVLGTQEVIRLAMRARLKPIHFVSSVDALISTNPNRQGAITEEPAEPVQIAFGYAQSKWAAERLLLMAREQGCPTFIYRPSWIEGHSRRRIVASSGFLSNLIQSCVQESIAPAWDLTLNIVPVDYVSRAIVAISRQQTEPDIFHLTNPTDAIQWNQIVDWLTQRGCSIHQLPYSSWTMELSRSLWSPDQPLYSFWSLLSERSLDQQWLPHLYFPEKTIDCQKTLAQLASAQVNCPIDDSWLWRSLSLLLQRRRLAVSQRQCG